MRANYEHARLAGCLVNIALHDPYPLMRQQSVGDDQRGMWVPHMLLAARRTLIGVRRIRGVVLH